MRTVFKVEIDSIIYILNENDKTASIFNGRYAKINSFIPYSIKYGMQEYKITRILKDSFKGRNQLKSIEFDANSEIEIIEDDAFKRSNIETISIPSHVKEIGEDAFFSCESLKHVEISKDSELRIIGQGAFQYSAIESFFIPHHVTKISGYAFASCNKLEQFEISPDSELKTIGKNAFYSAKIRNLYIPSSVSTLIETWNESTEFLFNVTVDPKNKIFKNYEKDENIIIGKSNPESDEYDILVFVNRNAKKINIPPSIKQIEPYAFQYTKISHIYIPPIVSFIGIGAFSFCEHLKRVEIDSESELKEINCDLFQFSSIESLLIPRHVTEICYEAFFFCPIKYIEFPQDSEIQIISRRAFSATNLKSIVFRPTNKYEYKSIFCQYNKLQIIEIDEKTEEDHIEKLEFETRIHAFIMIPTRFRDPVF
ncbi:hypothetical protein M9Y10_035971 [Tritrichomonas musculus]|uniref:Surface antigen BspA-like n=1 Tax=Tritrichomonas musculus TaxID=1915356 RepID=A0ABR2GVS1_9EUKA